MANNGLGFDIGSSSMKLALFRGGSVSLQNIRLPENMADGEGIVMPNTFSQFLKEIKRSARLPRQAAALVLPPSQVICRLVTLPKMTEDRLLMNLPYEFSDFIQGTAEQYFCDYALCEPEPADGEENMAVMAAVASKRKLEENIRMFSRGGVRLKKLIPREMALVSLTQYNIQKRGGPEVCCYIDLGHQDTRLTVVCRDRVQAARSIPVGGRDLDRIIADQLGVDEFLANTYKTGGHGDVAGLPAVGELCDHIAVELLKVLNFYQFTYRNSELKSAYLVGGGAGFAPLRRAVEGALELELLSASSLLPGVSEQDAAEGVFAAGAAIGGAK